MNPSNSNPFTQVSAINMVNYYNLNALPILGGRQVFIQFSQYKELKTDLSSPAPADKEGDVAGDGAAGGDGQNRPVDGHTSPVLRVIVEHMIYPITLDTLTQIFKKFGAILKLITFTKNNTFQGGGSGTRRTVGF
jgi:hypothetical protein